MNLSDHLRSIVSGEVDDSPETLEKFSKDASLFKVRPEVVVRPKNANDIESLVAFVTERVRAGEKVNITARAAGTDMTGGPLGNSIVLDMTTHMNRFIELGDAHAVAEPGMYFRDFDAETKKKNLEMPGYPASRNLAAIGGMVANDSGGEKNLKYGKTSAYIEEIDAVLSDGKVHTLKRLEGAALHKKLDEQSFEGEIYRRIADVLVRNHDVIQKSRPEVTKNSSGYALWDIGDGVNSLNLARLFAGSQGTLGIITKIRFKLVQPKPYAAMVVLFLNNLDDLGPLVPKVVSYSPDSFESYDDNTFKLATKYFIEFTAQMKTGIIGLGFAFLPEVWMLLTGGIPKLVLLVEFRSDTQEEALSKALKLSSDLRTDVPNLRVRVARNEREARKFWTVRRESFQLLRKKIRGMKTAPFIDDVVVLPKKFPEFFKKLQKILSEYDMFYTAAGHVGDGNFHIVPLVDPQSKKTAPMIDEISHRVYDLVLEYGGSISGEHNDGLIRTPYVEKMFGKDMYALFGEIRSIFDPQGIFNPGKKVGTSFADAAKVLDLPK